MRKYFSEYLFVVLVLICSYFIMYLFANFITDSTLQEKLSYNEKQADVDVGTSYTIDEIDPTKFIVSLTDAKFGETFDLRDSIVSIISKKGTDLKQAGFVSFSGDVKYCDLGDIKGEYCLDTSSPGIKTVMIMVHWMSKTYVKQAEFIVQADEDLHIVRGVIAKDGVPLSDYIVELYDVKTQTKLYQTRSNSSGVFLFSTMGVDGVTMVGIVPSGNYILKVGESEMELEVNESGTTFYIQSINVEGIGAEIYVDQ